MAPYEAEDPVCRPRLPQHPLANPSAPLGQRRTLRGQRPCGLTCSHYLFGFCVSAEPAAVRAALLEPTLLSALDAAVAARLEVVLVVDRCDNADPAADLADLLAPLSRSTFDAADAARLLVTSDLAIFGLHLLSNFLGNVVRRWLV